MIGLIIVLTLILVILTIILIIYNYIRSAAKKYLGTTDIKKAMEASEIMNQDNPKSLWSLENVVMDNLRRDFKDLNINELKSMAENTISSTLRMIETKNIDIKTNDVIKNYVESKIEDLHGSSVNYDNLKFHKTVLNKYENKNGLATLTFQTALEYMYRKDGSINKKVQDRYSIEFVFVIDETKVNIKYKVLGLNCPNCGAPVKAIGQNYCAYCSTGLNLPNMVTKRVWTVNNIKQF